MEEKEQEMVRGDPPRCWWAGRDPLYVRYHDTEWGVPKTDSRALFEKLVLEGFQAGLSWITVLRKRPRFREVFDGFDAEKMVRYDARKQAQLLADAGIIRNRAKIAAAIANARAFLALQEREDFATFLWDFVGGVPLQNRFESRQEVPAETALSKKLSKELKARGFRFCGPVTVYAFMQSVGLVNDHLLCCHRHAACARLSHDFASAVSARH